MSRYINENDIYALFPQSGIERLHISQIDELPRVDVVEVRHAKIKWVNRPISAEWLTVVDDNGDSHYGKYHDKIDPNPVGYCGECGKRLDDTFMHFCPNCGAKMDGGDEG